MTDIVERLNRWRQAECEYMLNEECAVLTLAADEIEKLRTEVRHWKDARQSALDGGDILLEEVTRLREEVERLRGLLHEAVAELQTWGVRGAR